MARIEILHAYYFNALGDYPGVIERSIHALALIGEIGQVDMAIDAHMLWASALWRLGKFPEAMQHGKDALQLARGSGIRLEEGRALSGLGLIALEQQDHAAAHDFLNRAVLIARELGHTELEAKALNNLANSAGVVQGDFALAREYYEQAYALNHERGDHTEEGANLNNLGFAAAMLGDFEAARAYYQQALSIAREVGNRYSEAYTLINLSALTGLQNDVRASSGYAREALELSRLIGDRAAEAWALLYFGHVSQLMKAYEQAQQAYKASILIRNELGQPNMATEPAAGLIETALAVGDLPAAMNEVKNILAYLSSGGTLDGTEEPLRIYYACYLALEKKGDPRSSELLAKAVELLDSQVSRLRDEASRRMFVENVPWRLAIHRAKQTFTID